jgi:hypothetical protein
MERFVICVHDKEKARHLFELLRLLDFVELVEFDEQSETQADDEAFFALAGLWEGREISLETIRQNAWPRQSA